MKEEIKEILDDLRKTADNTIFAVCSSQEELDKMPRYTANFMSINDRKAKLLLDYITNLQEKLDFMIDKNDEKQNKIDKAIEYINKSINNKNWVNDNFQDIYGPQLLEILQGSDE